jgi:hypothetical protein
MERNTTTLVGRGPGITHQFERSRLLLLTAGSQGPRTADLSDIASEASAEGERSAGLPALHLSAFTFHLSHSSFQSRAH